MNNVSMYVARYVCKRSKYYLKREGGGARMHCDEQQLLYCDVVTLCMSGVVAVQSPRHRRLIP